MLISKGIRNTIESLPHQVGHAGSWGGLIDLGITEKIGSLLNSGTTSQGGSDIIKNTPKVTLPTSQQMQNSLNNAANKVLGASTSKSPLGSGSVSSPVASTVPPVPQGPSQEDINREIDNVYAGSMDYLNQAENNLNKDLTSTQSGIEGEFGVANQKLGDQRTQAQNRFAFQETEATTRKEDAFSAARRIYDETRRGANQRFGGSSSAGQAASEIQGREFQRQAGETQRTHMQVMGQIFTQREEVEQDFNTKTLELATQKRSAMDQALKDFTQKQMAIMSNKAQIGQAKAQARLSALQDLRDKVYAIQLQNTQFEQALMLQKQQSISSLNNYAAQAQQALGLSDNAYQNALKEQGYSTARQGVAANGAMAPASQTNQYVGQIQNTGRKEDDLYSKL
jgi:hypothetical protein